MADLPTPAARVAAVDDEPAAHVAVALLPEELEVAGAHDRRLAPANPPQIIERV